VFDASTAVSAAEVGDGSAGGKVVWGEDYFERMLPFERRGIVVVLRLLEGVVEEVGPGLSQPETHLRILE
jgi:hypothetical protein